MKKSWTTLFGAAIAVPLFAQTVLYAPTRSIKDQSITLTNWGSGTISETDELAYEGTNSLRVSTRNYFQGGTIHFANPVDLSGAWADKNNLLRITFKVPDSSTVLGGGNRPGGGNPTGGQGVGGGSGGTGGGGGRTGGGGDEIPGDETPGGFEYQRGGTGGGGGQVGGGLTGGENRNQGQQQSQGPTVNTIRVVFATSDNKYAEAYIPVSASAGGDRGWRMASIPLVAVNGFEATNKQVKRISFSADTTATVYVGDLRIVNDTTPITGDFSSDRTNLALGDLVTFRANGFGGSSVLKYEWDFDATNGIQVDAEGPVVRRAFKKAGTYTVTLTVVDAYGLKKGTTSTAQITVNP